MYWHQQHNSGWIAQMSRIAHLFISFPCVHYWIKWHNSISSALSFLCSLIKQVKYQGWCSAKLCCITNPPNHIAFNHMQRYCKRSLSCWRRTRMPSSVRNLNLVLHRQTCPRTSTVTITCCTLKQMSLKGFEIIVLVQYISFRLFELSDRDLVYSHESYWACSKNRASPKLVLMESSLAGCENFPTA